MSAESWKLSLPCTREEARRLDGDLPELDALDPAPVLLTTEVVDPDEWRLDAYFEGAPSPESIALVRALVPSAAAVEPVVEQLGDEDWLTMSQAGLVPVDAGRFHVRTSSAPEPVRDGAVVFTIDAGLAFGTGQHETTTGCLIMLDAMANNGIAVTRLIDVGTGTGLLAFAAMHLWPTALATASDIDPISIDVTRDNAAANGIALGETPGALALAVAPGVEHALLQSRAPYDLVIANILAGPLIDLAPSLAAVLAPGGTLLLAGLLDTQADRVAAAYAEQGITLVDQVTRGDWPTLRLVRG